MLNVIVLSVIAGILGTGAGGLIGLLFKNKGNHTTSAVLEFSAGIMLAVVFFELLPEAFATADSVGKNLSVLIGTAIGMTVIFVLDFLFLKHNSKPSADQNTARNKLLRSGIIITLALALHDLPEGIALGSSGATEFNSLPLVILLTLHNIPEGMAVSLPLIQGGMKSLPSCLLSFASGAVTVVGAILGFALGNISQLLTTACLSLASGAMLYVTFAEILPQAFSLKKENSSLFILLGILVGLFTACLL